MKISILGDIALDKSVNTTNAVSEALVDRIVIANLEGPIKSDFSAAIKTGPTLGSDLQPLKELLSDLNVSVLMCANNHIGDYGEQGIEYTYNQLNLLDIDSFGYKSKVFKWLEDSNGKAPNIQIINMCDVEWGTDRDFYNGAISFDFSKLNNAINLSDKNSFRIVVLHDGKEYHELPSPELRKLCHNIIDMGVDVIICQHSHVVGYVEMYKNAKIYYGTGSFCLEKKGPMSNKIYNSISVNIDLDQDFNPYISETFFVNKNGAIDVSKPTKLKDLKDLKMEDYKEYWDNEFKKKSYLYVGVLMGHSNKMIRILNSLGFYKLIMSKRGLRKIKNVVRSRAHREYITNMKL
ncbi:CapA family protein [Winogradskyella sp.]|uniref:CapA family protein n=1 Tax=Winogradskyella sp. TaxID=1883156 RepID=UPI003AB689CF